ncbi:hypothetical protein L6164_031348 [Bauhinia variegata]|uniref:Uncharacterized protein n=1 Tax=Bauhinia variegata TaxID=167791 RepID=A0ACB9LEQ6_BAUVA|nr:hypothetical protein L6164_031348 [Bauhinia variegata]
MYQLYLFCDIDFPTFHATRVQVSEAIGTDAITEAEAAVVEGSDGSGSVNQVADEASANCKKLEFDLNELLPLPIEDNDA